MINPNTKANYLDNPSFCPKCDSRLIQQFDLFPNFHNNKKHCQDVRCLNCDYFWQNVFMLVDIEVPKRD